MNKKILCFACLFLAGCAQTKAPEPTQETPQNDVKTESWKEITDGKIEFVKMFPGAAQKNVYMTWKLFENNETKIREYRVDNKPISQEATEAVEAFIQAVDSNMIPSDGIYTCRYEQNQPQFKVELNKNGHHYSLVSSSDCLHAAPFNIRLDNDPSQWSLQLSGEIGIALEKALKLSGSSIDHIGETAAMLMLDKPVELEGIEVKERTASPDQILNPTGYYHSKIKAESEVAHQIITTAQDSLPPRFDANERHPEIACNQAQSPDCSLIQARYNLFLGNGISYHYPLKYSNTSVEISHKDVTEHDIQTLKVFRDSLWFKVYWSAICQQPLADYLADASKEKVVYHGDIDKFGTSDLFKKYRNQSHQWQDVVPLNKLHDYYNAQNKWNPEDLILIPEDICPEFQVSFAQSEKTAKYLKGIQSHLKDRDKKEITRGESWTLKSKDYPALVYYPEIEAFWIEPKDKAQDVINAYCQARYIVSDKTFPFGESVVVPDLSSAERPKSETPMVKRLCSAKSPKIAPNINIYFGDHNILAIFKTENGKTTVEN